MSDALESFATVVESFERWVLRGEDSGPRSARAALVLVVSLYQSALSLPPEWSDDQDDHADVPRLSDEEWQQARQALARLPFDLYGEVFNPTVIPPDDPVVGSLADDLGDIYRDVVTGLRAYRSGDVSGARWEWSFGFHSHWGEHATGAIRALHSWLVENATEQLSSGE